MKKLLVLHDDKTVQYFRLFCSGKIGCKTLLTATIAVLALAPLCGETTDRNSTAFGLSSIAEASK
jgi:hypothetical protein